MSRRLARLVLVAVFALAGPALAQTQTQTQATPQTSPQPAATVKPARAGYDPDQVVCRWISETGTRLGDHKVCMTRFQWEQQSQDARDQLYDLGTRQTNPKGWGN